MKLLMVMPDGKHVRIDAIFQGRKVQKDNWPEGGKMIAGGGDEELDIIQNNREFPKSREERMALAEENRAAGKGGTSTPVAPKARR